MLHEVLLALSGHPTPLFGDHDQNSPDDADFPLLSPSEKALLNSLGKLSQLHRKLRRHLDSISSSHSSVICRAVATSIQQTHLERFQQRVLDVESRILRRDASMVGAYNIVPLATVVTEFGDWHRRMAWYWDITCFILPTNDSRQATADFACSSARLIDRLRAATQTGFSDVEAAATELASVAESAWLRQLATWIIYGKLPAFGADDFFVQPVGGEYQTFKKEKSLLPALVTSPTATSMLFIGKCLHQVQQHRQATNLLSVASKDPGLDSDLASKHLQHISSLSLPLVSSQLSRTISDIRLSLSQNVLQHLLPMSLTLKVLTCFRKFFLIERGDFAATLITESEARIVARQQSMGQLLQRDPVKATQGLKIRDVELNHTLQQVWKTLAAEYVDDVDEFLEYAQSTISLSSPKPDTSRPSTSDSVNGATPTMTTIAFNDLLFPTSSELSLNISSPLDLLLSPSDLATYSAISSYLLAIRRGHQRLSELWRRTPARRDHPLATLDTLEMRRRQKRRATKTRKVWATCSAAVFLLSETSAFFEGEIVKGSYDHFYSWVQQPAPIVNHERPTASVSTTSHEDQAQRDPETLASGHRKFLSSLIYALLLTDIPYTHELRSLLRNVDNLIAFFVRLLDVQQKLDLEHQSVGESAHTVEEAQRLAVELDRARKRVDSDLKCVVNRLRQLDHERIGSLRYLDVKSGEAGDFEVWKGGGVDRLLMKLDFGKVLDDSYDIVRDH